MTPPSMGKKSEVDHGEEKRKETRRAETRREETTGGHVLSLLIGLSKARLGARFNDAATGCI